MATAVRVDVDTLLEDYAWKKFGEVRGTTNIYKKFKDLKKEGVKFVIDQRRLTIACGEPKYTLVKDKPEIYTLFESVMKNKTKAKQDYSFKTEKTTELVFSVTRDKGWTFSTAAELTLKMPGGIAGLKIAPKHEIHINELNANVQREVLAWTVESTVTVLPHTAIAASIVIEEMNYKGTYEVETRLSGTVVVSILRRWDNEIVHSENVDISLLFDAFQKEKAVQAVCSKQGSTVTLTSAGSAQLKYVAKHYVNFEEEKPDEKKEEQIKKPTE